MTYHLGRAMDNGLTQPQAAEVLTHIAFYAGWHALFRFACCERCLRKAEALELQGTEVEQMSNWTGDELKKLADSDDLHISPLREDGTTYGTPTWIWSVVVDGSLYVRAYNRTASRWYKAAMEQKRGRITAAGMTKDVTFELVGDSMNNRIDDAYRAKYKTSPYLPPMITQRRRSATMKIEP